MCAFFTFKKYWTNQQLLKLLDVWMCVFITYYGIQKLFLYSKY